MQDIESKTIPNEEHREIGGRRTENEIAMKLDVQRAMQSLDPKLQRICQLLALGCTKTQIAAELHKSRTCLRDDIRKIQRVFSRFGLEIYLKD